MVYHHAPVVTLSSIQVLLEHVDFKDNANPPSDMEDPLPTFTLVKKYNTRLVLVLDMSGSMEGERIRQLRQVGFLFELVINVRVKGMSRAWYANRQSLRCICHRSSTSAPQVRGSNVESSREHVIQSCIPSDMCNI